MYQRHEDTKAYLEKESREKQRRKDKFKPKSHAKTYKASRPKQYGKYTYERD